MNYYCIIVLYYLNKFFQGFAPKSERLRVLALWSVACRFQMLRRFLISRHTLQIGTSRSLPFLRRATGAYEAIVVVVVVVVVCIGCRAIQFAMGADDTVSRDRNESTLRSEKCTPNRNNTQRTRALSSDFILIIALALFAPS